MVRGPIELMDADGHIPRYEGWAFVAPTKWMLARLSTPEGEPKVGRGSCPASSWSRTGRLKGERRAARSRLDNGAPPASGVRSCQSAPQGPSGAETTDDKAEKRSRREWRTPRRFRYMRS